MTPSEASPPDDQSGRRLLAALQRPASADPGAAAAPAGPSAVAHNGVSGGPPLPSPNAGNQLLAQLLQSQRSSAQPKPAPSTATAPPQPGAAGPGTQQALGRSFLAQLQGQQQAAALQPALGVPAGPPPSLLPGFHQQPAAPALPSAGSGAALLQMLRQNSAAQPQPGPAHPAPQQQHPGYANGGGLVLPGLAPGQTLLAQLQRGPQQPLQMPGLPPQQAPILQQAPIAQGAARLARLQQPGVPPAAPVGVLPGAALLAQLQGGGPPAGPSSSFPPGQQQGVLTAEEHFIAQLQSAAAAPAQAQAPGGSTAAPSFLALLQRGGGGAKASAGCSSCPAFASVNSRYLA